MASWEKVFLQNAAVMESVHFDAGCVVCHGGDNTVGYGSAEDFEATDEASLQKLLEGKELAHEGLIGDPSDVTCVRCHEEQTCPECGDSLHTTLAGMEYALEQRGGDLSEGSVLAEAFHNHCSECHTSCGQCHVSRPEMAEGGFIYSHEFLSTPDTTNNCAACHGSRIGNEYLGLNEGEDADLHYVAGMACTDCHADELHFSGAADTRYENSNITQCTDCHTGIADSNAYHTQHLGDLSCQVCHSVSYKNCYSCHVALNDEELPYYTTECSEMDFEIGLNPLQSEERPYKYVVLRHAPVSVDTFVYYGTGLLSDFDSLETWKYATPHNIQLNTPQTATCDSCHNDADIFLTDEDFGEESECECEKAANEDVIVDVSLLP